MSDAKVRAGLILLYGPDTSDELVDRVSEVIGKLAQVDDFDFMVSGCDDDTYDHFDAECE